MPTLFDQTIAVTGATSGLGQAICYEVAQNGGNVILLGRNWDKLQALQQELHIKYPDQTFVAYQMDVINNQQVEGVFNQIYNEGRTIDVLINNAGVVLVKPLTETEEWDIHTLVDTNVKGVMFCTRAVLKRMQEKNAGKIINISSNQGKEARALFSIYSATKFAVHGFTEALKKELIDTDIHIYGVYPAGMKTDLWNKAQCNYDVTKCMEPKDVADIIIFMITRPEGVYVDDVGISRNYC